VSVYDLYKYVAEREYVNSIFEQPQVSLSRILIRTYIFPAMFMSFSVSEEKILKG